VVQVPRLKHVEKPEIVYVDTTITVPNIVEVEKIVEINREVASFCGPPACDVLIL